MFFSRVDKDIVVKPYLNCCSYCNREYGSKGIDNNILFKTFDHIVPLLKGRYSWDRKKYYAQSISKLTNIIDCCNECNHEKDHKTLFQWLQELSWEYIETRGGKRLVFKKKQCLLNQTRINNLTILINTKSEPYKTIGNLQLEQ